MSKRPSRTRKEHRAQLIAAELVSRAHEHAAKNQAQPIVTEEELRAREREAEERVIAKSRAATDRLEAVTRESTRRNPLSIARELIHPMWVFSVVFFGLLSGGWSPATVIVCFWFEKLTRVSLMAARIYIHRQATRKRGHYRAHHDLFSDDFGPIEAEKRKTKAIGVKKEQTPVATMGERTFLAQFVARSIVGEVLTVAVIFWALSSMDGWTQSASAWQFIKQEWQAKAWIIVLPLVIHFVIDTIVSLRQRSFASIKAQMMVTYGSANLIVPIFLLAMWIANYAEATNILVFACTLVAAKTIYEVSAILLGRDWEIRSGDRLTAWLWRKHPSYARYAETKAEQRIRDEEPMR